MKPLNPTLVLLGAALVSGCVSSRAHSPMIAGPAPVAAIRTIAMSGTVLPWVRTADLSLQRQFDSAFITELRLAGYRVVPPAEVDPIWHALTDTAHLYDPRTGVLNEERYTTAVRAMSRAVKTRFNADAWLLPDFIVRDAHYASGWCAWDGTKQYVQTKGNVFRNTALGRLSAGSMQALSLRVIVNDSDGREIYRHYGGVAALVRVVPGGVRDVRAGEALTDADRNTNAVRLALLPLVSTFP